MLFQLTMHKYFKKLRNESSSLSSFASENSPLNQDYYLSFVLAS